MGEVPAVIVVSSVLADQVEAVGVDDLEFPTLPDFFDHLGVTGEVVTVDEEPVVNWEWFGQCTDGFFNSVAEAVIDDFNDGAIAPMAGDQAVAPVVGVVQRYRRLLKLRATDRVAVGIIVV